MIFAVALGIPFGFFAAKRHGGVFDNLTMIGSLLGISVPIFFLAIILKYLFAVRWHWFTERRQDRRADRHESIQRTSTSSMQSSSATGTHCGTCSSI